MMSLRSCSLVLFLLVAACGSQEGEALSFGSGTKEKEGGREASGGGSAGQENSEDEDVPPSQQDDPAEECQLDLMESNDVSASYAEELPAPGGWEAPVDGVYRLVKWRSDSQSLVDEGATHNSAYRFRSNDIVDVASVGRVVSARYEVTGAGIMQLNGICPIQDTWVLQFSVEGSNFFIHSDDGVMIHERVDP